MKLELQDHENARLEKFGKILAGPTTDLGWSRFIFVPHDAKKIVQLLWKLLTSYKSQFFISKDVVVGNGGVRGMEESPHQGQHIQSLCPCLMLNSDLEQVKESCTY